MRPIKRLAVNAVWMVLVLTHSRLLCGQTTPRTTPRRPVQGQLTDGVAPYGMPGSSSEDVLLEMASRAAVIFVGRVTEIHRPSDELLRTGSAGAVVEVDFYVQRSVRGVAAGSVYALREWAGMWRDNPRFLAGQRFLMMLHAPGPGGLSSPVDGLDGAIPVRGGGVVAPLTVTADVVTPRSITDETTSGDQVDMRWLRAKALRVPTYADAPVADPGVAPVGGVTPAPSVAPTAGSAGTVGSGQASGQGSGGADVTTEALSRVIGLLGAVEALGQGMRSAAN